MMSKKMVKIICIVMAVLMALSAGAVLLQVFALDSGAYIPPSTGDNDSDYVIPITIGVIAVLAIVVCLVLPKLKKK